MIYFREREKEELRSFVQSHHEKAMAIYGRRRTGKTCLGECKYRNKAVGRKDLEQLNRLFRSDIR